MNTRAVQGWQHDELERVQECGLCGATRFRGVYQGLVDVDEGVEGRWSMTECEACGGLHLDPRPTNAAISRAYATYYTHAAPEAENAVLNQASRAARVARGYLSARYGLPGQDGYPSCIARLAWPLRQQLDYYMRHLPGVPGRVLDIGCGNGGFLRRAQACGWQVEGVEPDPLAAQVARHGQDYPVHSSIKGAAGKTFDVVTLSHVVEHLHEPRTLLRDAVALLRPGGMLWIAVPNIAGAGHRIYRETWQALEVPRHIVIPTARSLLLMAEEVGLDEARFRPRGRGAAKRFEVNERRRGSRSSPRRARVLSFLVDLAASVSPYMGEELVITAVKP